MFLDTTIIIDMFRHGRDEERLVEILGHIGNEDLYMSMVQVGEVGDYCRRNNVEPMTIMGDVEEFINVMPIFNELCDVGSEIKHEMRQKGSSKFSLTDGIILASARSIGQKVLTRDKDFAVADDVLLLS
jgi:predicted nucleic acid-binding protein